MRGWLSAAVFVLSAVLNGAGSSLDGQKSEAVSRISFRPRHFVSDNPWSATSRGRWQENPYKQKGMDAVLNSHSDRTQWLRRSRSSSAQENQRIVHLDLKGAPPRLPYFKQLFELIAAAEGTGVLIEWEDMFPFSGELEIVRNTQAYSVSEVQQILRWANESRLQVIPLAQTAGHLEWVLKHRRFAHLREVLQDPRVICLTNPDGVELAKNLIDQMLALHAPYSQFFHIGSDEVYQIGRCSRCLSVMEEQRLEKSELLLSRVQTLSQYIHEKHGKITLMWHDMLDHISDALMNKYNLRRYVEPVVWTYSPSIDSYLTQRFWQRTARHFPNVWGASAFKGANGPNEYHTALARYVANNVAWAKQQGRYNSTFQHFRGIILTGWQRFDHFAVLCELLPSSIPSLVVNLLVLKYGQSSAGVHGELNSILRCAHHLSEEVRVDHRSNCTFPGYEVYYDVQRLKAAFDDFQVLLNNNVVRGWLSDFNVMHGYSSPALVSQLLPQLRILMAVMVGLNKDFQVHMRDIFFPDAIEEFLLTHVLPLTHSVDKIYKAAEHISGRYTFPIRSFDIFEKQRSEDVQEAEAQINGKRGTAEPECTADSGPRVLTNSTILE